MNSLKPLFAASFAGWCLALAGFLCGLSLQAAQPPTITDIKDLAMDEDTVSSTIFFTIGDPDTPVGQLQLVRLTSNTNIVRVSDMVLGGAGAERTLKISPQPNAFGTVVLGIRVSDGQQEVVDTFTLTVRSVNDLPTMDTLFDRSIPEDGATGELPVSIGDLETQTASLTLSGKSDNVALIPPSAYAFGGQGANRTVVVTPAPDQFGSANIIITVNDGQDSFSRTFRLNVGAVDDGPTVSPIADVVTDEDTTSAPIPFWFGDIDTPVADIIVSAFPDDGVLLPPELFVLKGTGTNRTLTVTPRQNRSGTTKVTVRINDGSLHPTNRVFNVQVRPVNDLPAMTAVDDAVTNEDTTKVVNTVVTDVDNVVDNVGVVGFSDNQSVLPDSGIRGARNGGLWAIALTPAPNSSGVARVTLVATDPAGGKTTNSFNFTVAPIDDPPEISQIPDQIADEDTVIGPLLWRVLDVDTPLESLTITRSSAFQQIVSDDGILIQGTGTNRLVRIVPQPNASGSTTITLTVSDGTSVKRINFQATFNAVNDRPRISAIADQTILMNRNTGPLAFTIFDVETPAQGLTLEMAPFNTNLVLKSGIVLAGTGTNRTVTVTPLANRTGSSRIAIAVTDQGGAVAVSTFTLNVVGNVDPPRVTVPPVSKNLRVGEELLLEVIAEGEGPFTYQWRFKGKAISGATERTFRIPAVALENAGDFDVVVTNAGGSTASQTSKVGVKEYDFGDAPGYAIAANPIFAGSHLGAGVTADTAPPATDSLDDGTVFPVLLLGKQADIVVNASSPVAGPDAGYLNVWVDFNQNQVFGDVAGEWVIHNVHLAKGANNLSFPVPGTIPTGGTWARLRYASESGVGPSGIEPTYTGEVEDYPVTVQSDTTGGGGGDCVDCDFGDAPDTYKTTLAAGGAYHITKALVQGQPFVGLGPIVDVEPNGAPGPNADGDDLTDTNPVPPANVDDEDGVRFRSALVAGQTGVVEVVTRSSNLKYMFLNAWIDFGIDGTFSNVVDRIFSGRRVLAGTNVLTFPIPATARPGASYARFRLTGGEELQAPTRVVDFFGGAPNGEVEDLKVTLEAGQPEVVKDFGDAPETVGKLTTGFPTTLVRTGAWHTVLSGFHLGNSVDGEGDGQPQLQLLGDDSNGDDEDGITFPGAIVSGGTTQVQVEATVPAGQTAFIDAWIDYNGDLDWDDAGEKVFSSRLVVNGVQTFSLTIPAGLKAGPVASRWRLSKQGGLDYKGGGGDGEVEDHRLTITVPQSNPCNLSCLGKDFWLAFPGNYSFAVEPVSLDISIVGPSGTTGTVNGLNSAGVRINSAFTIPASGVYRTSVANLSDLGDLNDSIAAKGVHVTSSANVGVFAVSKVLQSTDGYLALTTEALGTEYVVGTYGNVHGGVPELNGTQFAVVASQPNTVVTIVPSYLTGVHVPGTPYSVTLTNAGDCYQLRNTSDSPADLSGTSILSDKPIGVFGSHRIANVNSTDVFFADYLVEQLLPVNRWSTEFYTTPLATRSEGDVFRVISSQPDTTVVVGSDALVLAEAGEVLELTLTSATKITADKPVQLLQFATSSDVDGVTNADPFMVTVPARAHWSTSHAFATPASGFSSYYANVVAPSTTTGTVKLDGVVVTGWTTISGTAYSWSSVTLSAGGHAITADKEVGVIVYGWGLYESFGYAACLFFGDTTPPTGSVDITTLTVRTTAQSCTVSIPDLRDHVSAEDNCNGEVFVEQTPAPGTDVPPGDYDIQLWAIDGKGNRAVWHVAYHVIDAGLNQQEVDHLPADLVLRCSGQQGAAAFWNAYTELGCTRLPATTVPPSGTVFPPGTTNVVTVTFPPTPLHPAVRVGTFKVIVDCTRKRDVKINLPTIDPTGAREIVVEWEDGSNVALQVANQPEGPWIDVPNARARFAIKIANERGKFYRLIER